VFVLGRVDTMRAYIFLLLNSLLHLGLHKTLSTSNQLKSNQIRRFVRRFAKAPRHQSSGAPNIHVMTDKNEQNKKEKRQTGTGYVDYMG